MSDVRSPSSGHGPSTAVIVVNYGSHQLLAENFWTAADLPNSVRVVVVDSFFSTGERTAITALADDRGWSLVLLEGNPGFGAAANVGAAQASALGCEVLLFLNPDATADIAVVLALSDHVRDNPRELVSPKVVTPDGREYFVGSMLQMSTGRIRGGRRADFEPDDSQPWLSGACLAVASSVFDELGGFDEDYFLYWEDVDLSYRAQRLGATLTVRMDLSVVHDAGGTQENSNHRAKSALFYRFMCRNRLLFASKHLDRPRIRNWILRTPGESWQIVKLGGRRQLIESPRLPFAALRGTAAGLRSAAAAGVRSRRRPRRHQADMVVLTSYPAPRTTTNPYITMLDRSLRDTTGLEMVYFTWKDALRRRSDVFHVHWPEGLVGGRTEIGAWAHQLMFAVVMLKLQLTRTPVVRTVHNMKPPEGLNRYSGFARLLLAWVDRRTTLSIVINETTELPAGRNSVLVPLGHSIDWFAEYPTVDPLPGRVVYFGLIRPYKNVTGLVRAFSAIGPDAGLTLVVAGAPATDALAAEITEAAENDPRIDLRLGFMAEADLVEQIGLSELVILPYREMHNSSAALSALSLGRPVLVPENDSNVALRDEVGADWVLTYDGELSARTIVDAVAANRANPKGTPPALQLRSWSAVGEKHREAYRLANRRKG